MKKHVISLLAVVVAIAASSFSTGASKANDANNNGYRWWNYYGAGQFDQSDPSYYSLDEDNFPDCTIMTGTIYCEVKAKPSQWNEEEPDLSTIISDRRRQ